MILLNIQKLTVQTQNKILLKDLDLVIRTGEVHAIMGPNGAGKSTFAKVIAGHPDYQILSGKIELLIDGQLQDLATLSIEDRARAGLFIGFQYPIEVPGVSNQEFLRASFNAVCAAQGIAEMEAADFMEFLTKKATFLGYDKNFAARELNVGFSGGEKKRNELLQMAVLSPRMAILDETDSGLDVDSLRVVGQGINKLRSKESAIVLITHYQRLLDIVEPDFVHILSQGSIVKTGDKSLALKVENSGYEASY